MFRLYLTRGFHKRIAASVHMKLVCVEVESPFIGVIIDSCPLLDREMSCGVMVPGRLYVDADDISNIRRHRRPSETLVLFPNNPIVGYCH